MSEFGNFYTIKGKWEMNQLEPRLKIQKLGEISNKLNTQKLKILFLVVSAFRETTHEQTKEISFMKKSSQVAFGQTKTNPESEKREKINTIPRKKQKFKMVHFLFQ